MAKDDLGNEISCDCTTSSSVCFAFKVPSNDSYLGQMCQNTGTPNNFTCVRTDTQHNRVWISRVQALRFPILIVAYAIEYFSLNEF